jgi:hypothetical protein
MIKASAIMNITPSNTMALPRSSNLDRARWRAKCREKLSEHISKIHALILLIFSNANKRQPESKLGISINPSEVRLIPRAEDPYSWQYLPARIHLFEKNLSKHSICAYMELCREVGVSFEAVAKEVRRQSYHLNECEANSSTSKFSSPDQQQVLLTELQN